MEAHYQISFQKREETGAVSFQALPLLPAGRQRGREPPENYLREELHTGALRRGIGNTSIDFALLYADSKERKNMILGEMKYAEHYHHQKYGTTKAGRGKLDLYGPFYYAASSPSHGHAGASFNIRNRSRPEIQSLA
jgi:hypothetical protein